MCPLMYPLHLLEGINRASLMQAGGRWAAFLLLTLSGYGKLPSRELLIYDVGETVPDLLSDL